MKARKLNRTGPKMTACVDYVHSHPGCTPMQVAAHIGPNGSLKYGYAAVNRTIEAGLVTCVQRSDKKGCYRLYPLGWVTVVHERRFTGHGDDVVDAAVTYAAAE